MSQKSKQKSRSKPQLEDYAFPSSPQSQIFEHLAQFRDTSAAPCATGKSNAGSKKRNIDWLQDFVPGTSINPEFNSLDLPSFLAGYLVMIRTYDPASNAHMLAILEVLMAKAISYT